MSETPPSARVRAASTIIFLKDTVDGPPEVLMIERSAAMKFAGGALVFPGGGVDEADRVLAQEVAPDAADIDDVAARIAGIREAIEEAGIAVGLDPAPDDQAMARIRAGLADRKSLAELIHAEDMRIEISAVTPFARWCPPSNPIRRFDTRFFIARLPKDANPVADGGESVKVVWGSAEHLLAGYDAETYTMIFPTLCNMRRIAQFGSFEEAYADATTWPVETIEPQIEMREGVEWLTIPRNIGYPWTAMPLAELRFGM